MHATVITQAELALADKSKHENDIACLSSPDPVVRQGWTLKKQAEAKFHNMLVGASTERILIHVPSPKHSPAGYSLFTNLAESLEFIGIPTRILEWEGDTALELAQFNPTVFLTSDHETYLSRIDWHAIGIYRRNNRLRVGLTASLEEYDNTPLLIRLKWAASHNIDFYYSFRDEDYVKNRNAYRPFFEAKYKILYLPFGANILHYYPVAGIQRDLNFVIMATRKSEHIIYMKNIANRYAGFIDGPGWGHVKNFNFNRARDRYIYARAKVGLNVHLPEQIEWACELNERTYQLAACGVPQLVDHAKLLDKLFGVDNLHIAESADHYCHLFQKMHDEPDLLIQQALALQHIVFSQHTTFHRANDFVRQLNIS
jgi:hypothetical protein